MDQLRKNRGYLLLDSLVALFIVCILIFIVLEVKKSETQYYKFFQEKKIGKY